MPACSSADDTASSGSGDPGSGSGDPGSGSGDPGSGSGDPGSGSGDPGSGSGDPGDGATPTGALPDPTPTSTRGAAGERGHCAFPVGDAKVEAGKCVERTLPGTGHTYCVKANPDCRDAGAGCGLIMTFNMGSPHGLSYTYQSRVGKPHEYGRWVVVGGGGEVDTDVMAELPRALLQDYPGIDADRIYALGNSRGAGSISAIAKSDDSAHGSTWDVYAAVAVFGGRFKHTDVFRPRTRFSLLIVNGWDDVEEPDGPRGLAVTNGCSVQQASWQNVEASDPLMHGGDGTDIAQKLTFGECPGGDVMAYRFKDEGHVVDFKKHFDPKVRALHIAWDFFQGRTRGDGGVEGTGSACYAEQ